MTFDGEQQKILLLLLEKFKTAKLNPISKMDDLWAITDQRTEALLKQILKLDPRSFGFRGQPIPNEDVVVDIVKVNGSQLTDQTVEVTYDIYLPRTVHQAFERMNESFMSKNSGRKLTVDSGYRSPSYQISVLIHLLVKADNFEISKTLKRVAMPGYSQHSSAVNTAVDIGNIDLHPGSNNLQEFSNSPEYKWLSQNANSFGFYESYPEDNPYGIIYEPWHWQYLGI